MNIAMLFFLIVPPLVIAGWLSFLFLRRQLYEKAVIVFLSTVLAPVLVWNLVGWLLDNLPDWVYERGIIDFLDRDAAQAVAMIATFAALCLRWAREGQQIVGRSDPEAPAAPTQKPISESTTLPTTFPTDSSVRDRLEVLEQLRRDSLISDGEYSSKRAEILAGL